MSDNRCYTCAEDASNRVGLCESCYESATERTDKLSEELDLCLKALRQIERVTRKGFTFCLWCDLVEEAGHKADCLVGLTLQAVLGAPR